MGGPIDKYTDQGSWDEAEEVKQNQHVLREAVLDGTEPFSPSCSMALSLKYAGGLQTCRSGGRTGQQGNGIH